jgi:hypothetical protein
MVRIAYIYPITCKTAAVIDSGYSIRRRHACHYSESFTHRKRLMMDGDEGFIYALKLARCPHSLAASLAVLPSMSLIPSSSIVFFCD